MKAIRYNGAKITLKPGTVRTRMRRSIILGKLGVKEGMADEDWLGISNYADFLTRTDIDGDIGFAVPHNGASDADYLAGLDAFLEQPEAFYEAVVEPLLLMDSETNDSALTPETPKND